MSADQEKEIATSTDRDEGLSTEPNAPSHESVELKVAFDQKLALKLDLHILLPMLLLNFLSLIGRTNIGAALIQKLPADLKLTAIKRKYNISYMRYLSVITALLGIVTVGQGFDQSYSALLTTRFFVGIFDAGLIPGCVYICSLYYPASHLQWRMSMLMVANIASNIASNILAFAIAHIHSSNGYHGWRWIFIVEGCLTFAIGTACCYSSIGRPETSTFLSQEEKDIIAFSAEARTTTIGLVSEWKLFFSNILNYIWAACYVMTCSTTYSVAIFAPSFVTAFHPKDTVPQVQGQVVPIFIVSAFACLLSAYASDRLSHRSSFAIAGYLITAIGFIILRQPHITSPQLAMLGLYFVSIGTYTSLPLLWNLTLMNLQSPFQKAIGCGFVVGIGNVGGFASAWMFRTSQAPHYHSGMTDSLIITLVSAGLIAFAWVFIVVKNRKLVSTDGAESEKAQRYYA